MVYVYIRWNTSAHHECTHIYIRVTLCYYVYGLLSTHHCVKKAKYLDSLLFGCAEIYMLNNDFLLFLLYKWIITHHAKQSGKKGTKVSIEGISCEIKSCDMLRRLSDRCETEDRPLQTQISHVYQVPCWSLCSVPKWPVPSDSREPITELSDPPEPLSSGLACWCASRRQALWTLAKLPVHCNIHQGHWHCCVSKGRSSRSDMLFSE